MSTQLTKVDFRNVDFRNHESETPSDFCKSKISASASVALSSDRSMLQYWRLVVFLGITVFAQPLLFELRTHAQPARLNESSDTKQLQLRFEFSAPAMGSHVDFVVYANSQSDAKNAIDAAVAEIERLSPILSNYDLDSEITKLCSAQTGSWTPISSDLHNVLIHSRRWYQLSAGKFDITVGPLSQLWKSQRRKQQLPTPDSIENAKRRVGWASVDLDPSALSRTPNRPFLASLLKDQMVLDLSGIAVGYIVDAAFEKMRLAGLRSILINAGGDIRIGDAPPGTQGWRIAIAGLGKGAPLMSMLELQNCAVTTSGDLNQFVEVEGRRYSHFIDPETGDPIERRQSVTVISDTTVDADAGATALAVLGMQRASELFDGMPISQAVMVEAGNAESPLRLRWLTKQAKP